MNFRNISSWCIRNPVPPIVFFIALMIAGIVSFMMMDVNNMPDIDFPAAQIRSDLPDGILEPQIERIDGAGEPIMFVAAETNDMSLEQLSWYVDNDVSKRLLSVEGIAAVTREGGVAREI